jgi:glycerate-2-kinase
VLTKEAHLTWDLRQKLPGFECWEAAHPLPDDRGVQATARLLAWLEEVRHPRHLLLLLSGGASSLLVAPVPSVTLRDLWELNAIMLRSGLPIEEINVVRKHLDRVKGGHLGALLRQRFRRVTQLIASDICVEHPEQRLDLVGSGPALPDPSTVVQARALLEELRRFDGSPVLSRCEAALRETPKRLDLTAELLADHRSLAEAARRHLGEEGRRDSRFPESVTGDVATLAPAWAHLARRLRDEGVRGTLVATGEPTVVLGPRASGRGGRCQQLAVLFAREIAGEPGIALLAGGSDGTDGPTPYAGARVDGDSWARLESAHGAEQALSLMERQSSTELLEGASELLLHTGPTGHNLNDLYLLALS